MSSSGSPVPVSPADKFYDAALGRIRRFILILGAIGVVVSAFRFGRAVAAGFFLGALISYMNHASLERVVSALGERVTTGQSRERGGTIVARAVFRYAAIAMGAYVIFKVSQAALYGFLAGICLTIAAMACETAVEVYGGLRRGF
jgi:ATP synthase I chain